LLSYGIIKKYIILYTYNKNDTSSFLPRGIPSAFLLQYICNNIVLVISRVCVYVSVYTRPWLHMFFDLDGGDWPPPLFCRLRVNTHNYIAGCVLCVSAVLLVAAAAAAAAACAFEKRSLYCGRDESATMFPLRKKEFITKYYKILFACTYTIFLWYARACARDSASVSVCTFWADSHDRW